MALPLKYNFRNITVRKSSTLATALTIGLTVGVYLMVMALARVRSMPRASAITIRVYAYREADSQCGC